MSVSVFPFILQLLVYIREKYKNYSGLFSARSEERREAFVFTGYVIN